ncbi:TMEM43 family protein [Lysobacter sp. D1-1-M9]|uniref:TMEM43 family protein n=1 Tax=Novilysobacter longmucuonensis TaxID=3098603 RepID=UPI002FC8A467
MSRTGAALALWWLLAVPAWAQEPAAVASPRLQALPQGEPDPGPPLRDPDFGVRTRAFGLDRQVEMYQWRVTGEGYRRVWNGARIDSSGFAPGHDNPALPIGGQRWWSQDATLDGRPIDQRVLRATGEWHPFRPSFSRLPLNMAATFQPEGDGLGSAENPLDPQVGDLRITWRELRLPPLPGRVELRDGAWHLSPRTAAAALNAAPLPPVADRPEDEWAWVHWWPWLLGGTAALVVVIAIRRRRGGS